MAGKVACTSIRAGLVAKFTPVQLSFAPNGGAKALVHAVRAFCTFDYSEPVVIVKFDFNNAFNTWFRKFMLCEVRHIMSGVTCFVAAFL